MVMLHVYFEKLNINNTVSNGLIFLGEKVSVERLLVYSHLSLKCNVCKNELNLTVYY